MTLQGTHPVSCCVGRHANFIHFLSHLAQATPHPYRSAWLEETGVLNAAEDSALRRFRDLESRYPIDPKPCGPDEERHLTKPFTVTDDQDVWDAVCGWVDSEEDYRGLREIFDVFGPRFERIQQAEEPLLNAWATELPRLIVPESHAAIGAILHRLHESDSTGATLDAYLLFSLESRSGGHAELGPDRVAVHCSRVPHDALGRERVLWTLYHEWTHTFQWDRLVDLIFAYLYERDAPSADLAEAERITGGMIVFLVESLARVVGTYCYRKFYHAEVGGMNAEIPTAHIPLFTLTERYVEAEQPIDCDFLDEFIRIAREANYDILTPSGRRTTGIPG